ncbi:MAG: alpha/beta hydrolase [Burkholderiales bacterium]
MTDSLQHHYANVNGQSLHYATLGAGKLMLFVHGFPEFWYEWFNQLHEFGKDHQAVALDMRGYNLSSKPADVAAYRAKHLVEDLRQLIEHLGHKSCVLVAHDWGGAAAWSFAATLPQYVEKLIIINSPHPATFTRELVNSPAQQAASQYMLLFRMDKAERVMSENNYARLATMLRSAGSNGDWLTDQDLARYTEAWSKPGAVTGGLNYYRASPMYPPTEADPGPAAITIDPKRVTVNVPTLVIWGEADSALLRGNLDGLEQYVPDLTVKRIPTGSHWVVHEQPEVVNNYIRDFIRN